MSPTQFDRALHGFNRRRPFRRFFIELESGRDLSIAHPEAIRQEGDLYIFRVPDGGHVVFAAARVTRLHDSPTVAT